MGSATRGPVRLVLFGAPGVGKGTQAARLVARIGVPHVATGDMLRAAIRDGTPEGVQARAIVERGDLVPDALIGDMVRRRLLDPDLHGGFVLDGYPRTVGQAEDLGAALGKMGWTLDGVVNLVVPPDEIARRLAGRRVCPACGAAYHVTFGPPRREGVCDRCGAALVRRADDSVEVVEDRLRVYESRTAPVLEYYRERGLLHDVDGRGRPEEVAGRVESAVAALRG